MNVINTWEIYEEEDDDRFADEYEEVEQKSNDEIYYRELNSWYERNV